MQPIKIKIDNYRAIKSADIDLNGITVVCGDNGSGKSTVSRLLYYTFRYANRYKELVDAYFDKRMQYVDHLAGIINNELDLKYKFTVMPSDRGEMANIYRAFLLEAKKSILSANISINRINRYLHIIYDEILGRANHGSDILQAIDEIITYIGECESEANEIESLRPYFLFRSRMSDYFNDLHGVSVDESGVCIASDTNDRIPLVASINKSIYIDTPMVVDLFDPEANLVDEYREQLYHLMFSQKKASGNVIEGVDKTTCGLEINEDISKVIKGRIYLDTSFGRQLMYIDENGREMLLKESATGIKSFGILQRLLQTGELDRNTLLIIDEPEAHLHPQWVIEYARILIQIRKRLDVRMLIASHSTDMVSALRYIAEKQQILDDVSFYKTEASDDNDGTYNYKNTGVDIEPQFEGFNRSLDKLDEYGAELQ